MNLDSQQNYIVKSERTNLFYRVIKTFFAKEKIASNPVNNNDIEELVQSIKIAHRDWLCANSNFNYANDQEIIDYYTYMIKAYQVRYEYLIKKAKEQGIKGGYNEIANLITYGDEGIN